MELLWFIIIGLVAGGLAGQMLRGGGLGLIGTWSLASSAHWSAVICFA